jgi:DNA-binding CsgD family transcriptional regulator
MVPVFYFIVQANEGFRPIAGGPSLAGIIVLVFLPMISAWLLSAPSRLELLQRDQALADGSKRPQLGSIFNHALSEAGAESQRLERLPFLFWKFMFAVFVFSITTSLVSGFNTAMVTPSTTLDIGSMEMLTQFAFCVVLLILGVNFKAQAGLGKLYLIAMIVVVLVMAISPLVAVINSPVVTIISFTANAFDLLVWCLLAMIVSIKHINAIVVFGLGRGLFALGSVTGWFAGSQFMPLVADTTNETVVYLVAAGLILFCSILIFSERDYDRFFSGGEQEAAPLDIEAMSLGQNIYDDGIEALGAIEDTHRRPYKEACMQISAKAHLSAREQDVFELLALGRGSENIAKRLNISLNTARTHTHNIYAKLDVHSRQELIEAVEQHRLCEKELVS